MNMIELGTELKLYFDTDSEQLYIIDGGEYKPLTVRATAEAATVTGVAIDADAQTLKVIFNDDSSHVIPFDLDQLTGELLTVMAAKISTGQLPAGELLAADGAGGLTGTGMQVYNDELSDQKAGGRLPSWNSLLNYLRRKKLI